MKRRTWLLAVLPTLLLQFAPASAQTPPSTLRGTVNKIAPGRMEMRLRGGDTASVAVPEGIRVTEVAPASVQDIAPGSYVGCTSVDRNGQDYAVEVHIFPPAGRGTGEGSRPYDLPNSTMTNGTAGTVGTISGPDGHTLTIDYKGGTKKVLLTPETKVVTFSPGSLAEVTPGAQIIAAATRQADGTWSALRISVGKDGSVPPM